MKKLSIIIGLLGFFAISCATTTANTEPRKLSGINPEPAEKDFTLPSPLLAGYYEECMDDCVHENGGSTKGCHCTCGWDTGGCNKTELKNNVAFNWKFWKNTKKDKTKEPTDEEIKECISKRPCVYKVASKECSENAHQAKNILQKQGVKVASINDQNPFMLLEEVSQDAPPPLMLVDDYSECIDDCTCRGGSNEGCHAVCE